MLENNNTVKMKMETKCLPLLLLSVLIILFSSTSCGKKTDKNDLASIEYYILDLDKLPESARLNLFPAGFKAAELSKNDIAVCESLLENQIEIYNKNSVEKIDLIKYGRQFIGAKGPSGELIVYINCFCDPELFADRMTNLVKVFDGGDCYFQLKVDLVNKRIFDFSTNGLAYFGSGRKRWTMASAPLKFDKTTCYFMIISSF